MKKTKDARDYHAKLTIHGLPDMSKSELKRVANWLREQALIINKAKEYGRIYTGRLMK